MDLTSDKISSPLGLTQTSSTAVDDVWVKPNGELILSDVKSTSKNNFDWEETWNKYEYPKGYRRQLEMYQWLFRKNGFKVSDTAYLVYFNGLKLSLIHI